MAVWIVIVGTGRERNWTVGRDNSIWATPKRSGIEAGDRIVFWQAVVGNRPGKLIGTAIAAEPPHAVPNSSSLPWDDSQEMGYRWSFPLRDIEEMPIPRDMTWTQVREAFGVTGLPQQPRRADVVWSAIRALLDVNEELVTGPMPEGADSGDAWPLRPGDYLTRPERQLRFGGSTQGGIQPSRRSPNVFVYSDPGTAVDFGYNFDGWTADGTRFLYTGDGQNGDQQLTGGNKAILEHQLDGRALRLFVADGVVPRTRMRNQRYVGEFDIDSQQPYVRASAPGLDRMVRSVIVFQLVPVGPTFRRPEDSSVVVKPTDMPVTQQLPVAPEPDAGHTRRTAVEAISGTTFVQSGSAPRIASRKEASMVQRFQSWLNAEGHQTFRHSIRPPKELQEIWTDIYDETAGVLYEAKASGIRSDVRMAIGQLLDYRRFVEPTPQLALLVPSIPSDDLLDLLRSVNIGCMVEMVDGSFESALTAENSDW